MSTTPAKPAAPQLNDRKAIFGWCMYDWANSAYGCTVMLLLPIYFERSVVGDEGVTLAGMHFKATTLWAIAVSVTALLAFISSPVLGAVADFSAAKKRFLLTFAYIGSALTLLFWFCRPGDVIATLVLFVFAQFAFVSANVFYDAFLPQVVTEDRLDKVSGWGYAFGYVGGGLQFAGALGLMQFHEKLGITEEMAVRISMIATALWWGGFTVVTAVLVRETPKPEALPDDVRKRTALVAYTLVGVRRTWATMKRVRRFKHLVLFLVAFMLYNDGIQTVIEMSSVYGSEALNLEPPVLMGTFLALQLVAMIGALVFGAIAGRLGAKHTIAVTLVIWSGAVIYAFFIQTAVQFFILGMIIGFVIGGAQSLSRSYYSAMIPPDASAEFFGFYTVFSKFSAMLGPALFAVITQVTDSPRYAILSVVVFFVAGLVLLLLVNDEKAREARLEGAF